MNSYEWKGDDLIQSTKVGKNTLKFSARNVARQRTGVHARVSLTLAKTTLAWSVLNIERDEDRTRLANSAHRHLTDSDAQAYPRETLKHDLDVFCDGLWDEVVASFLPEEVEGAPEGQGPVYVLKPFVVHGGGTILFAPPGSGKSWWAFLAAVSVDSGTDGLWDVTPAKTMIINLERSRNSTAQRLGAVNASLGLPRNRPLVMLNARGRSLKDVLESAARAIDERAVDFVVLDSISRSGMGKMVEDDSVNSIMDTLNRLCPTWLALAHSPRADATHAFGSVMFDAAADVVSRLVCQEKREEDELGIGVEIHKANDLPKAPMDVISLTFNGTGLKAVSQASIFQYPELNAGRKISMTEEVQGYLETQGQSDATTIARELGRNRANIASLLRNTDRFIVVKKEGHKTLYGLKL
jgi:hypothetical protein